MTARIVGWVVLAFMGCVSFAPAVHRAIVALFPRTPSAPEAAR